MTSSSVPNVLMVGTGEYTTGYVDGQKSTSDKSIGVVAVSMFDLRRRGLVGPRIGLCGTNGTKFPGMRNHLSDSIGHAYRDMNVDCNTWPADDQRSCPLAYKDAIATFQPGDVITIFTPDDSHFPIALEAIERGLHVLVTKPAVKTLADHRRLMEAAERKNVLVAVEVHKRWDPIYSDARIRARTFGDFSYFYSYMSQPKKQLDTFRAWFSNGPDSSENAGHARSDISYYLNSHHVDFHVWTIADRAKPVRVRAVASGGVAKSRSIDTEDTITLTAEWESRTDSSQRGVAVYTSSWIAPTSDVHSQQRFHYMGSTGEIQIDQAHRGYSASTDRDGYKSLNPLFMRYTPDANGNFVGQNGYGYQSIANFADAATRLRRDPSLSAHVFDDQLATIHTTALTTAILEAGRRSLDSGGRSVRIDYEVLDNGMQWPVLVVE